MSEHTETPPREPEIELLAKLARGGLRTARAALWLAGLAAIAYGLHRTLFDERATTTPSASGTVWLTIGLPLMLRANWLLDASWRRYLLLLSSAVLWFAPMMLTDDSSYGFVLRIFATIVAFLCLVVWRTLWRLGADS